MLKAIETKGLFEMFDYYINLNEERITILTGPNGFGKTTILKIIHSLSDSNFLYLTNLLFREIRLHFINNDKFVIRKEEDNSIVFLKNEIELFKLNRDDILKKLDELIKDSPFRQIDKERWIDRRTDQFYDTELILKKFQPELYENIKVSLRQTLPEFPSVYLIKEQRLLRRVSFKNKRTNRYYIEEESMDVFSDTIEEYSRELIDLIKNTLSKYSQITQKLDSSFPRRLFEETREISEEEFNSRFEIVKDIQKSLNKYELSVSREDNNPTFKRENAKALLVYLDDTEKKLEVFKELLKKLDMFTDILNNRRFTHKQIRISLENGFIFFTEKGRPLGLTDLSSGEQQEVVLLFELLFKISPNTLVLIDEPEISLHVAWQKEFLNDLSKITELENIRVIVATHSPQIINEHWDLTVDLEEILK